MNAYARRRRMAHGGTPAIRPTRDLRDAATRLVVALLRWRELAQQRYRLLSMDDRMLKDIGVTRADALHEGMRPFWDSRGIEWTQWR
jgi:uncharacterized protein YjiS (DUF1127 family)